MVLAFPLAENIDTCITTHIMRPIKEAQGADENDTVT